MKKQHPYFDEGNRKKDALSRLRQIQEWDGYGIGWLLWRYWSGKEDKEAGDHIALIREAIQSGCQLGLWLAEQMPRSSSVEDLAIAVEKELLWWWYCMRGILDNSKTNERAIKVFMGVALIRALFKMGREQELKEEWPSISSELIEALSEVFSPKSTLDNLPNDLPF